MMGKPLTQAQNEVRGMASRARYLFTIAEASLAEVRLPDSPGLLRRIRRSRSASCSTCPRGTTRFSRQ